MSGCHHRKLPEGSAFLSGRGPIDPAIGLLSERLQVSWRQSDDLTVEAEPHAHRESDEGCVVLAGSLTLEVEGVTHVVGAREFAFVRAGLLHRIAAVGSGVEALVLRAPGRADKVGR